ncbi:MAG: DUF1993 domain-containing protein [Myxococcota bacterium]
MNAHLVIRQLVRSLHALDRILSKAEEHATAKSFDVNVLATARLAPDMFPLTRQIGSACDAAKFAAAYTSGQTPPPHPDTETTVAELHARIAAVLGWLEGLGEDAFAGSADRKVTPKWLKSGWIAADDYLLQVAVPNFYFHVTTAYDILRHNGVPVGKADFLSQPTIRS